MSNHDDRSKLVEHIAGLTSLRDVDLLEISLLKSVASIAHSYETSLIALRSDNSIAKRLDFAGGKQSTFAPGDGVPEEFLEACDHLDQAGKEFFTLPKGAGFVTAFRLVPGRRVALYVMAVTRTAPGKNDVNQIVGMLTIYRNFQKLLTEAQTDELTGLPNRRAFDQAIGAVYENGLPQFVTRQHERRHEVADPQYWVSMIDIDHFKRINDQFGHLMGDEVLVRVTQALRMHCRDHDALFRYGGEEFALISMSENRDACEALVERLRASVESVAVGEMGPVTVSVGSAYLAPDAFPLHVVDAADKAMMFSKNTGRNRVSFAADLDDSKVQPLRVPNNTIDLF